ncbi:hypothetical protein MLD38_036190 [Melastoma candidum]|uniref:Uncharacterized protein n=1 Tax=Melastoma candidum TaxID=119954 RepID=A0ACB9LKT6_9MYRT|nr:hypothetical protein MLD38_036190 [Melastoma candidum]
MNSRCMFLVSLAVAIVAAAAPVRGQIPTMTPPACTPAMISSFTPCMNFVTNSSSNGTLTPTSDCCTSLRNLTNGGLGCACLLVTGSVPFQIPINRTLAFSLPRACNMPGVPLQCKAAANAPATAPAPGPGSSAPVASPTSSPAGSLVPEAESPSLPPESSATPTITPPSTSTAASTPTSTTGSRSNVTPTSDAKPSYAVSPAVAMLVAAASTLFYCHY